MARLLSLGIALALGATVAFAADEAGKTAQAVELVAAIHGGMLRAEGTSLGFTSGDNVVLTLTNASAQPLAVRVTPGMILAPDDPEASPVAVRRVSGKTLADDKIEAVAGIVLAPRQTERYALQAFSIDCRRRDPAARARLTPTALDPVLGALFRHANEEDCSLATIQAAVWLHAGGLTDERLTRRLKIDKLGILDARDLLRQAEEEAGRVKP